MAKDTASSRIPRLDGVSRIPMPGGSKLRAPNISTTMLMTASASSIKPTQIFRAPNVPNTSALMSTKTRPNSHTVNKATATATLQANSGGGVGVGVSGIKKSASVERINSAVNLLSKRTTKVFKKYFSMNQTSDKTIETPGATTTTANTLPQTPATTQKRLNSNANNNNNNNDKSNMHNITRVLKSTPQTLTRSETFVRSKSDDNEESMLLDGTQKYDCMAQSTPAPATGGATKTKRMAYESTPLLRGSGATNAGRGGARANGRSDLGDYGGANGNATVTRPKLGTTQTFDVTAHMMNALSDTMTLADDSHNGHKLNMESTRLSAIGFGKTIELDVSPNKPLPVDATRNVTIGFGKTMDIESPYRLDKFVKGEETQCLKREFGTNETPLELASPATNATYSNPGSVDNLPLLAHISMPAGLDGDVTLCATSKANNAVTAADNDDDNDNEEDINNRTKMNNELEDTLIAHTIAPDKAAMKLPLNSTLNTERLLDISCNLKSPARHIQLLNLTKEFTDGTPNTKQSNAELNTTQLLYMTPQSAGTTPDHYRPQLGAGQYQHTPRPVPYLNNTPMLLKSAQSDLVLPIRTPEAEQRAGGSTVELMDIDSTYTSFGARTEHFYKQHAQKQHDLQLQQYQSQHDHIEQATAAISLQDINNPNAKKTRNSFGFDLTDSTLDCSIDLVDSSMSSTAQSQAHERSSSLLGSNLSHSPSAQQLQQQFLKKQNSFDLDESLGILTPDQMKEFLDSTTHNTNNLELPLSSNHIGHQPGKCLSQHQHQQQQHCRMDQTPSPEELPLDTVDVKTDISDLLLHQQQQHQQQRQQQHVVSIVRDQAHVAHQQQLQQQQQQNQLQLSTTSTTSQAEPLSLHTDTEISKAEQLTKSSVSKISTSFITSVTSVTSLDTGYQGDGEMSRPASRGACDHSPSNGPNTRKNGASIGGVSRQPSFNQQQQQQMPPIRRQDPMTDSDFFTESDADDVLHRGDRRAQVIDGQLYGPAMMQQSASVFITEDPQLEDSCMESSGIFTDVENRCDEDLALMRRQDTQDVLDMSPGDEAEGDDSTETVKSNLRARHINSDINDTGAETVGQGHAAAVAGTMSCSSQTSSTIQSSFSNDRLSAATTLSNRTSYCSVDGVVGVDCVVNASNSTSNVDCNKSFSSLEETFDGVRRALKRTKSTTSNVGDNSGSIYRSALSSGASAPLALSSSATAATTSSTTTPPQSQLTSVQRENSSRKHASLNSLCQFTTSPSSSSSLLFSSSSLTTGANIDVGNACGRQKINSKATVTGRTSVTSCVTGIKSSPSRVQHESSISSTTKPTTPKSAKINTTTTANTPILRKTHSPNKWNAVMNKIASNKSLIKTNYSDVKSKVSTTRLNATPSPTASTTTTTTPTSMLGSKTPTAQRSLVTSPTVASAAAAAARLRRSPLSTPPRSASATSSAVKSLKLSGSIGSNSSANSSRSVSKTATPPPPSSSSSQQPQDKGSRSGGGAMTPQSPSSPPAKRLQTSVSLVKRGRSYSKDSQKSSQSDLSLMVAGNSVGGSPKLLAKTPLRAAKKRDVRNLSISPTDLGPPPKTQQTIKGQSTRVKQNGVSTVTQKKSLNNQNAEVNNATKIASRQSSIGRSTPSTCQTSKSPSPVSTSNTSINNNNNNNLSSKGAPLSLIVNVKSKSSINESVNSVRRSASDNVVVKTPTTIAEQQQQQHRDSIKEAGELTLEDDEEQTQRSSTLLNENVSETVSECIITNNNNHSKKRITASERTLTSSNGYVSPKSSNTTLVGKKSQNVENCKKKSTLERRQTPAEIVELAKRNTHDANGVNSAARHLLPIDILEEPKYGKLREYLNEGKLDVARLERYLVAVEKKGNEYEKGMTSLIVMIQYMTEELDAFSCPATKQKCAKTQDTLTKTHELLEEAKATCQQLQNELASKEAYYAQREEEQLAAHRSELELANENITEMQMIAKQRIREIEAQLANKDDEHRLALEAYHRESTLKLTQKTEQLAASEEKIQMLQQRLQKHEANEQELRDALTKVENQSAGRLSAAGEREQELTERIKSLTNELQALRNAKETSERELRDQLSLSQDELKVARSMRRASVETNDDAVEYRQQTCSPTNEQGVAWRDSLRRSMGDESGGAVTPAAQWKDEKRRLENEADSLRTVLELKQQEISKLHKKYEEVARRVDEQSTLMNKVSLLEANNEMLRTELATKNDREKNYQSQIEKIQRALEHANTKKQRLSYDNEELQWHLKQRSQQLHLVESKLLELSASESASLNASLSHASTFANSTGNAEQHQNQQASPPVSPIGKGVIEKNESVSWVLEMDDETPEAAASKMVKRAGSLRSSLERSPTQKRTLSTSSSTSNSNNSYNVSGSSHQHNGPNPLSQSMSASVIRQHSNDSMQEQQSRSLTRTRSQSVVNKSKTESKSKYVKYQRQLSCGNVGNSNSLQPPPAQWTDPLVASSPINGSIRPRTSTHVKSSSDSSELFCRGKTPNLITCDTSTLNTGERLDMHSFPKALEKFQQIQESAGEAMVSGTNSEDESCSASSDDIASSASSASSAAKHPTLGAIAPKQELNSHMSIEDVLLLDRANSLSVTPMEVSWSEDVDAYSNDSAV